MVPRRWMDGGPVKYELVGGGKLLVGFYFL